MSDTPPSFAAEVAGLVQGYIDDKIAELRYGIDENNRYFNEQLQMLGEHVRQLQLTVSGMRDGHEERFAAIEGQLNLPEHVYRNFIKSEAERLRIVKKTRKGTGSYGGEESNG